MKRIPRLLAFALTAFLILYSCSAKKESAEKNLESCYSNTEIQSIFLNGESREYILYIPDSYDGVSTIPLVLNFHGFGESASDFINNADMRTVSESNTFILVYPQGSCLNGSSHWNACPTEGDNKSDLIAAVASVSGAMLDCIGSTSHPMPVVHLHGTYDGVLPYNGSSDWSSVQSTLDYWINFNKTITSPTVSNDNSGGMSVEHYIYDQGDSSVSVEHYKFIGGDHVWFSSTFRGRNTSELIWNFMSKYDINGLR